MSDRLCTCHPSEAPKPCQKRYALSACQAARIEQLEEALAKLAPAVVDADDLWIINAARAALLGGKL